MKKTKSKEREQRGKRVISLFALIISQGIIVFTLCRLLLRPITSIFNVPIINCKQSGSVFALTKQSHERKK